MMMMMMMIDDDELEMVGRFGRVVDMFRILYISTIFFIYLNLKSHDFTAYLSHKYLKIAHAE